MNDLALRLPASDAQRILVVHALEEADRAGTVLDLEVRRQATREALGGRAGKEPSRWLAKRARALVAQLTADGSPYRTRLRRLLRLSDLLRGLATPLIVVAFLVGMASNEFGPERRVNLLAPPLLLLIVWNLTVFALLGVRMVWAFLHPGTGSSLWLPRLEGWLGRVYRSDVWIATFLARWLPACRQLAAARFGRALHLAALAMAGGVVAGMYLRGLVLAYRATWESTFLGASQVEALLALVLKPAAAVLGVDLPPIAALEAPAAGPAGLWIHLWAATAVLFVGLPRLFLAGKDAMVAWRARRRVEIVLPAAYVKRLRASASAREPEVQVVPFSYRPGERSGQRLRELLQDLAGARAHIRLAASCDYGAEPPEVFDGTMRVVVFNLAQTPEVEVHGQLLRTLRDELPDGQGLLVLVDDSPLRRKLDGAAKTDLEERLDSRRRAWRRVVAAEDLVPVFVDLEASGDVASARDQTLDAMGGALWPSARKDELAWSV